MRPWELMVVAAAIIGACAPPPNTPATPSAESPSPAIRATTASPAPSAIAWRGLYLGLVSGTGPLIGGGALQLVDTRGQLPGKVILPDKTFWGAVPPQWSPDGRRALLRDRDLGTYVLEPSGTLTELDLDRVGHWQWYSDDEVFSVHQHGGGADRLQNLLVIADSRTGRVRSESAISLDVTAGVLSPDHRWLAFSASGPGRPLPAFIFEIATQRLSRVSDAAVVAGWLQDGHLVLRRDDGVVETMDPAALSRQQVRANVAQALAQPHRPEIVGTDLDGTTWSLVPGRQALRSSILRAELHAISGDGSWLSFTEPIPERFPAASTARAGVINLRTGAVTYACERDCEWLVIR